MKKWIAKILSRRKSQYLPTSMSAPTSSMTTPLRRSARIAARNAAKTKLEAMRTAHAFHQTQINYYGCMFVENNAKKVVYVQNDLAGYNPYSHEYRVAVELMKRNTEATTDIAKTEAISSVLAWMIEYPHLLHQIPSFPILVHQKITELSLQITSFKANLLKTPATDCAEASLNKILQYGAYTKLQTYIQIMHRILKKMAAK